MCSEPRESNPARIHFCVIDAESVDVQAEIAAVAQQVVAPLGLRGFTKMLREAEVAGEIRGRMRAMARGCLPEENPPALSLVVSQPDLFELRWKLAGAKNSLVRAYHGEPGHPDVVVVRIHRKETDLPAGAAERGDGGGSATLRCGRAVPMGSYQGLLSLPRSVIDSSL